MSRYQAKPRYVDAKQFTGSNAIEICQWANPEYQPGLDYADYGKECPIAWDEQEEILGIIVDDDEEEEYAGISDWITRDNDGQYHVLSDEDFHKLYTRAERSDT